MSRLTARDADLRLGAASFSSGLGPRTVQTYHVFLASPGDVEDERNAVRDFFDRYNRSYAAPKGLRFEVVDWENYSSAGVGRPQELITQQTLERFRSSLALVVGVMAQRFGSPSGTHESGTEEEFEWAISSWRASGFPEIKWFFREIKQLALDPEAPEMGVSQWMKVQAFRRRMDESNPRLYTRSYSDLPDFKELLDKDLGQWLGSSDRPWFDAESQIVPSRQASPGGELFLQDLATRLDDGFVEHMQTGESLSARRARERYIPLVFRLRENKPDSSQEGSLEDFIGSHGRLLLVGAGGGGKTTTLKHLAAEAARSALQDVQAPLPVYLRLNTFDSPENGFDSLMRRLSVSAGLALELLEEQWRNGDRPLLFLLDGLNEVPLAYQPVCVKALLTLMHGPHQDHRYVVTSRPGSELEQIAAHPTEGSGLKILDVLEFGPGQVRRYLGVQGDTVAYDQLSAHIQSLASNPFLLWAITRALVIIPGDKAPRSRGGLFRALIDHYILEVREHGKPAPRPTRYSYKLVKKPVLSQLALDMTKRGITTVPEDLMLWQTILDRLRSLEHTYQGALELKPETFMPDHYTAAAFLDEIIDNGLLVRESGSLRFMHESVQEYFAASALQDRPVDVIAEWAPEQRLGALDVRAPTFETIVTLAGLLTTDKAVSLADTLLSRHPLLAAHVGHEAALMSGPGQRLWSRFIALTNSRHEVRRRLGARCLEVFPSDQPEVIGHLLELLDLLAGDDAQDHETANAVEAALRSAASTQSLPALVDAVVSDSRDLDDDRRANVLRELGSQRPGEVAEALLTGWRHASTGLRPRLAVLARYIDAGDRMADPDSAGSMHEALLQIAVDAEVQGWPERAVEADLLRSGMMETPVPHMNAMKILVRVMQKLQRPRALEERYQALGETELADAFQSGTKEERSVALKQLVARRSPLAIEPAVDLVLDANGSRWIPTLMELPLEDVSRVLYARAEERPAEEATQARRLLALLSGRPSTDVLERVLEEEGADFRVLAVQVAGRCGPSALKVLRHALSVEPAAPVINAILTAIGSLGEGPAHRVLLDFLFDPSMRRAWPDYGRVVEAVGDWNASQPVGSPWAAEIHEALVAAKASDSTLLRVRGEWADPVGRWEALAEARRWLPDHDALSLLRQAAEDDDIEFRRLACWALACAGDTAGWRELIVLELDAPSDQMAFVQDVARRLADPSRLDSAAQASFTAAASEVLRPALAAPDLRRRADALDIASRLPDAWLESPWRAEAMEAADDLLQRATGPLKATAVGALSRLAPDRERLVSLILNEEDPTVRGKAREGLGDVAVSILQDYLQKAIAAGDTAAARRIAATLADSDNPSVARDVSARLLKGHALQSLAALLCLGNVLSRRYSYGDKEKAIIAQAHALLEQSEGRCLWHEYCLLAAKYPAQEREFGTAILRSFFTAEISFVTTEDPDIPAELAAEAASSWPDDLDPLWLLALANLRQGKVDEARAGFKTLSERFDTLINHVVLAHGFGKIGEPAEALRHARRAAERDDKDSDAHFLTGQYAYIIGDLEESEAATRRALQLKPMDAFARCNLGLVLLAKGAPDPAWTEYKRAVAIARRSPLGDARTLFQTAIDDLDTLTDAPKESEPTLAQVRLLLHTENQLRQEIQQKSHDRP
jgi:tetratricopeptide (TPR) repeat protein